MAKTLTINQCALIRLVSWNADAAERAGHLESFRVDASPLSTSGLAGKIRAAAPAAIVIDLDRLPSHGRAVATMLRSSKSTREIPIVFAGGAEDKIARLRGEMPEASFTSWEKAAGAVRQAIARGPVTPVRPQSYMQQFAASPLTKKLDLKAGMKIALIGAPEGFVETLRDLPEAVEFIGAIARGVKLAMWFVRSSAELASEIEFACARLPRDAALWIFFPKQSGGLRSDFNKLDVQRAALRLGLVDYKICSVDEDWSGMKFKPRTHTNKNSCPSR